MKTIPLILFFLITSIGFGQYVPTPDKAVSIAFDDDETEWSMQYMDGNSQKVIAEFTPVGQNINSWEEMVAQEITFTKESLTRHLDSWKKMVHSADSKIEIEEKDNADGSVTIIYKSKAFNEYSIRRFMRGSDGIYALAYHMRLNQLDQDRADLWSSIIDKAELIRNPQKP